jgi:hypothetical protein
MCQLPQQHLVSGKVQELETLGTIKDRGSGSKNG